VKKRYKTRVTFAVQFVADGEAETAAEAKSAAEQKGREAIAKVNPAAVYVTSTKTEKVG
jgi:hypothetical protein